LVSSVMFFSFSSAIVIFTYGIGLIDKGGLQTIDLARKTLLPGNPRTRQANQPSGMSGMSIMQPDAVVLQPLLQKLLLRRPVLRLRLHEAGCHSWCPARGWWVYETSVSPWRQVDTKDTGCLQV
jgi:hypothetical protein